MGHLFRALNLSQALQRAGQRLLILVNDQPAALQYLQRAGLAHAVVDVRDLEGDWEGDVIDRHGIRIWIDDRLDTAERHAAHVKRRAIPLATFDDRGPGAAMADLHVAALGFYATERLGGRRVLRGVEYLVLNPDIARHRRLREGGRRMVVSMGGSDTYGLTPRIANCLRAAGRTATLIVGPAFRHDRELSAATGDGFEVKRNVESLIEEFQHYDIAVTAGGVTPFEANASGLPCIVVASEVFEVPVGRELARLGGSVFAGHHAAMEETMLTADLPLAAMSRAGMEHIGLGGADRVVAELLAL
jgi:spore coat polysaccharide biosynthesis predicted glycosyltransferase SpsG